MVSANDFHCSSDSDAIQAAIDNRDSDCIVIIPPRCLTNDPNRKYWSLDKAIPSPANITVVLQN